MAVVRDLKEAGYGVHLATNQAAARAVHMRSVLGYDDLFDVSLYSCELGVVKPDPAFFREAARRIGARPEAILFVDDSARNVDGARAAGLVAEHWDLGADRTLRELLATHGVEP
jgi:putative hydrolase of the HAD superfamily